MRESQDERGSLLALLANLYPRLAGIDATLRKVGVASSAEVRLVGGYRASVRCGGLIEIALVLESDGFLLEVRAARSA